MKLLLLLVTLTWAARCTIDDYGIYRLYGGAAGFATRFRPLGGYWVNREEFERAVIDSTHLSAACATCYGQSYECGKQNCIMACILAGDRCTACLNAHGCIATCNACTGFI